MTELQEHHQARHNVTVDSLTKRLTEAEELGLKTNNPAAAVSAIKAIAQIHGLLTNKQEVTGTVDLVKLLQEGRKRVRDD